MAHRFSGKVSVSSVKTWAFAGLLAASPMQAALAAGAAQGSIAGGIGAGVGVGGGIGAGAGGGIGGGTRAGGGLGGGIGTPGGVNGNFGANSNTRLGAQGSVNSNGPNSVDRDIGLGRAEDRESAQGLSHSEAQENRTSGQVTASSSANFKVGETIFNTSGQSVGTISKVLTAKDGAADKIFLRVQNSGGATTRILSARTMNMQDGRIVTSMSTGELNRMPKAE